MWRLFDWSPEERGLLHCLVVLRLHFGRRSSVVFKYNKVDQQSPKRAVGWRQVVWGVCLWLCCEACLCGGRLGLGSCLYLYKVQVYIRLCAPCCVQRLPQHLEDKIKATIINSARLQQVLFVWLSQFPSLGLLLTFHTLQGDP